MMMEFLNMNYIKTENSEDYIKISDICDEFFVSEYYNSLLIFCLLNISLIKSVYKGNQCIVI
jgi:hypothetical protein